ncbi:hypothetical protein SH668x_000004 [Planctomicrobium sp. SH668]|uniref:hypothetical protein n=1 Tax=Planctomicrobium sp. SH668 TaxID=3448126 RepID=UPI003F5B3F4A
MSSIRAAFLPGIILGIGVGLLSSHFLKPASRDVAVDYQTAYLSQAANPSLIGSLNRISLHNDDSPRSEEEFDIESLDDSSPLKTAIAIDAGENEVMQTQSDSVPPPISPPRVAEPQPLRAGDAAPLSTNTDRDRETIRGIIDIELSDLPAEKREVWFEALKEVKKEDVPGILKMWKLLGGPIPGPTGMADSFLPASPSEVAPSFPDETMSRDSDRIAIQQAIAIHERNLLFATTPGFIPSSAYLIESIDDNGDVKLRCESRLVLPDDIHLRTGALLDIAVRGPDFIAVIDENGQEYLTRFGRLTLNNESKLSMVIAGKSYVVLPGIQITQFPKEGELLQFGPDTGVRIVSGKERQEVKLLGEIELRRPMNLNAFEVKDTVLFQIPEGPDGMNAVPHGSLGTTSRPTTASILQEVLEFPEINLEREKAVIQLFRSRL